MKKDPEPTRQEREELTPEQHALAEAREALELVAGKPPPYELTRYDEDDDDLEVTEQLPTVWTVCGRCDGEGHHTNPAIDGHGISAEEWARDWDEEDRRAYAQGLYDVRCEVCRGKRLVAVVDREACTDEQLEALDELEQDLAYAAAERAAERRMGC